MAVCAVEFAGGESVINCEWIKYDSWFLKKYSGSAPEYYREQIYIKMLAHEYKNAI